MKYMLFFLFVIGSSLLYSQAAVICTVSDIDGTYSGTETGGWYRKHTIELVITMDKIQIVPPFELADSIYKKLLLNKGDTLYIQTSSTGHYQEPINDEPMTVYFSKNTKKHFLYITGLSNLNLLKDNNIQQSNCNTGYYFIEKGIKKCLVFFTHNNIISSY